jgi:hypothetical protein
MTLWKTRRLASRRREPARAPRAKNQLAAKSRKIAIAAPSALWMGLSLRKCLARSPKWPGPAAGAFGPGEALSQEPVAGASARRSRKGLSSPGRATPGRPAARASGLGRGACGTGSGGPLFASVVFFHSLPFDSFSSTLPASSSPGVSPWPSGPGLAAMAVRAWSSGTGGHGGPGPEFRSWRSWNSGPGLPVLKGVPGLPDRPEISLRSARARAEGTSAPKGGSLHQAAKAARLQP